MQQVLEWLVSVDANLNIKDRWGGTPLQDAMRQKNQEAVEVLVTAGGKEKLVIKLAADAQRAVDSAKPKVPDSAKPSTAAEQPAAPVSAL